MAVGTAVVNRLLPDALVASTPRSPMEDAAEDDCEEVDVVVAAIVVVTAAAAAADSVPLLNE